MDIKDIRQIIKMVEASNISEFELEEGGTKLRISKNIPSNDGFMPVTDVRMSAPAVPPPSVSPVPTKAVESPVVESTVKPDDNILEIRSPMVGTFYRAPSPDADPYVQVGQLISVGQTLCVVEAMKLMNEIESEFSGKIVKILVDNAQPVEYNQVLFLIQKS